MRGKEGYLSDEVSAEISYLFHFCHKSCSAIAQLVNLPHSKVYSFLNSKRGKMSKKSTDFIEELGPINAHCPKCGCDRYIEPIISDGDTGKQFVLPINTGIFDVVCYMGHRYQYDWSKHLAQKERKDEGLKTRRDYVSVPIRGETSAKVEHTLDNAAKTGRCKMQSDYRRSWRRTSAKLRAERDNLSTSHQCCSGEDVPKG